MENSIFEMLKQLEIDTSSAISRFGENEELCVKYYKKFAVETDYSELKNAIEQKRYDDAVSIAHSFKGVTGNLGINELYNLFSNFVSEGRSGCYDNLEAYYINIIVYSKKLKEIFV